MYTFIDFKSLSVRVSRQSFDTPEYPDVLFFSALGCYRATIPLHITQSHALSADVTQSFYLPLKHVTALRAYRVRLGVNPSKPFLGIHILLF